MGLPGAGSRRCSPRKPGRLHALRGLLPEAAGHDGATLQRGSIQPCQAAAVAAYGGWLASECAGERSQIGPAWHLG
eukprot:1998815-Amphidinium_carterae.2